METLLIEILHLILVEVWTLRKYFMPLALIGIGESDRFEEPLQGFKAPEQRLDSLPVRIGYTFNVGGFNCGVEIYDPKHSFHQYDIHKGPMEYSAFPQATRKSLSSSR